MKSRHLTSKVPLPAPFSHRMGEGAVVRANTTRKSSGQKGFPKKHPLTQSTALPGTALPIKRKRLVLNVDIALIITRPRMAASKRPSPKGAKSLSLHIQWEAGHEDGQLSIGGE